MGLMAIIYCGVCYPCALVNWYERVLDEDDNPTGMYVVQPECIDGEQVSSIIHLDSVCCAVHLAAVCIETLLCWLIFTFHTL